MEAAIAFCLIGIFAAETGLTENEATAQFSAQAGFIMVLFKAASCLKSPQAPHHGELKSLIIRTIDQTLDDVAQSSLKA